MAVIGISGKIGSGKDTVGKIIQYLTLQDKYPTEWNGKTFDQFISTSTCPDWQIRKFATKLKQMVCLLTGCTMEQLEDQTFKSTYLSSEWDWYKTVGADSNGRPIYLRSPVIEEAREELGDRVYKVTYRELLQVLGTEALRNIIHENVHVNALFADYKTTFRGAGLTENDLTEDFPNWIITDTRFPNEAKAIKDIDGIIIRVERDWKIQRRIELENTISDGIYDLSTPELTYITGKGGYIEFQLALEEKTRGIGKPHPSETALDNYNGFNYIVLNDGTIEDLINKIKRILIQEKIINEAN